jgi:hypothetical protein
MMWFRPPAAAAPADSERSPHHSPRLAAARPSRFAPAWLAALFALAPARLADLFALAPARLADLFALARRPAWLAAAPGPPRPGLPPPPG